MGITEEIKNYLELLDRITVIEKDLKELHKESFSASTTLAERMRDENVDSLEVDGIKFQPKEEIQFSLSDGSKTWDNPIFFKWLRDQGLQDIIKIKESVHYGTRNKILKELKEDGKPLPDFVKVGFANMLKFNKSAVERRSK